MTIGQKIREFRLKKALTQEKLAELLCISFQAVSKWETDASLPDISMVAPLCHLLGVSADELLGVDIPNKQAKIDGYARAYSEFAGDLQKTEALRQRTIRTLREGLRLYPDSRLLKRQLSTVLFFNASEGPICREEKQEMCRLCGELIADTEDIFEKSRYIAMYCEYARLTGNAEQGKAYARMLPEETPEAPRGLCFALCCEDEAERREELTAYLLSGWGRMRQGMLRLMTETALTSEEILALRKKQEQIHAILMDEDDGVRHMDFDEFQVARAFYRAGDLERTADYLEICLNKWTNPQPMARFSPWRAGNAEDGCITEEERKNNAAGFVQLVSTCMPDSLRHERVQTLLTRARSL